MFFARVSNGFARLFVRFGSARHRQERLLQVGLHLAELRHPQAGGDERRQQPGQFLLAPGRAEADDGLSRRRGDLRAGLDVPPDHFHDLVDLPGVRQQDFHRPQLAEPTRVELELAVERNPSISDNHVAEGTIWTKGPVLRARESSGDMKASIDLLVEKLERQVKRYREKRHEEPRRRAQHNGE